MTKKERKKLIQAASALFDIGSLAVAAATEALKDDKKAIHDFIETISYIQSYICSEMSLKDDEIQEAMDTANSRMHEKFQDTIDGMQEMDNNIIGQS